MNTQNDREALRDRATSIVLAIFLGTVAVVQFAAENTLVAMILILLTILAALYPMSPEGRNNDEDFDEKRTRQ